MLTQPAERDKLRATIRLWALVYLVPVARVLQVPVEPREGAGRQVVQEAPIRGPFKRELRGLGDRGHGGSERSGPAGQ